MIEDLMYDLSRLLSDSQEHVPVLVGIWAACLLTDFVLSRFHFSLLPWLPRLGHALLFGFLQAVANPLFLVKSWARESKAGVITMVVGFILFAALSIRMAMLLDTRRSPSRRQGLRTPDIIICFAVICAFLLLIGGNVHVHFGVRRYQDETGLFITLPVMLATLFAVAWLPRRYVPRWLRRVTWALCGLAFAASLFAMWSDPLLTVLATCVLIVLCTTVSVRRLVIWRKGEEAPGEMDWYTEPEQ